MTYHVDRFYAALIVLAGHGHIKQRLIRAYEDHLDGIDEDDLPVASKQSFADLRQSMQQVSPLNGESAVCASVRKMSPQDASECATRVVEIFSELVRLRDEAEVAVPLNEEVTPVRLPPFLVKSV